MLEVKPEQPEAIFYKLIVYIDYFRHFGANESDFRKIFRNSRAREADVKFWAALGKLWRIA